MKKFKGMKSSYNIGSMWETQAQFNPKKRLTLYDQSGKRWWKIGSRQSKRHQSENYVDRRNSNQNKPRQLPQLGQQSSEKRMNSNNNNNPQFGHNHISVKYNKENKREPWTAFRAKTSSVQNDDEEFIPPRAQKFTRVIGDKIRIEINQQKIDKEELKPNVDESKSLLFYDFNAGARQFSFGIGSGNIRLATRGEFRRTGMNGAKLIDTNKIETDDNESTKAKRRPITSHFRCGDRLPSRASKTRERIKRIQIGIRKKTNKRQQGLNKNNYAHESVSPKNKVINNMMLEHQNNENIKPSNNKNFKFRETAKKKVFIKFHNLYKVIFLLFYDKLIL